MDTDSDLLLPLYQASRTMTTAEFQDFAIRLIRPVLRFDSAIWGSGYFSGTMENPLLVPLRAYMYETDPAALASWREINRADKVIPIVRAVPWVTCNFHAPTLFQEKHDLIMRDYAQRYGRQNYLVTALGSMEATVFEWCSLYRPDPDDHFTESERARCQTLVKHLFEALRINQLAQSVLVKTTQSTGEPSQFTALAKADGTLLSAQRGFLETCTRQWREFDQRSIPSAVMRHLLGAGAGMARETKIVLHANLIGEHVLLNVQSERKAEALPPRRMDVATLFAEGLSCKEIAKSLAISPSTARNQIAASYQDLGATNRRQLKAALTRIASGVS